MFKILLLVSFAVVSSNAQGCSVCGDGKEVGNADAIFEFAGQPAVPCGLLQLAGETGQIPLSQCAFLPPLLTTCECQPNGPPPTEPRTPAPIAPIATLVPTASPVDPTASPVEPTASPVDPTASPVEPTASPVETTEAPALVITTLAPIPISTPSTPAPESGTECTGCWTGSSGVCKSAVSVCYSEQLGVPENDNCPAGTVRCFPSVTSEPTTSAPTPTPQPTLEPCPEIPGNGCSICGETLCIGAPDAVFAFPGQPNVACNLLQSAGYSGLIPLDQCEMLSSLVGVCECRDSVAPTPAPVNPTLAPIEPSVAPTPATVDLTLAPIEPTLPPVTAAPITSAPVNEAPIDECPEVPATGCSVCGANKCISNPDAVFTFPGQPSVPCSLLQSSGYNGYVPLDQCIMLPPVIGVCECKGTTDPTASPVTITPSPTDATPPPTVSNPLPADPTPAPVDPTSAPVDPSPLPTVSNSLPSEPTPSPITPTETPVAPTDAPVATVAPTPAPVAPITPTQAPTKKNKDKESVAPVAPTDAPVPTVAPTSAPVAPVTPTPAPTKKNKDDLIPKPNAPKKQMMTPPNDGIAMVMLSRQKKMNKRKLNVKGTRGKQDRKFRGQ